MKTQISRNSRQKLKNYSSVCHQQGRMLTDSDLTEQALLSRDRLNQALRDVIGSGTPRHNGLMQITADATPSLHWGSVYVDGIPAEVMADETASGSAFEYESQLFYPQAPQLPDVDYRLYVDVWERSVNWLEDDMLRDPGLHGADTTTRTQTMAQVKWCRTDQDPNCRDINPSVGEARVHLQLRSLVTANDPCDACAEELELNEAIGNYLFRVEIHDVKYDQNEKPEEVVFKWSSENGAEAYKTADVPPDFAASKYVYEFFDEVSEKQLGQHLARDNANQRIVDGRRVALEREFSAISVNAKTFVRRWDGWCRIVKSASGWEITEGVEGNIDLTSGVAAGKPGHITQGGSSVTIELAVMTQNIELADHAMLAGDYWTTAVRESIHQQDDILLQDEETLAGALPQGEPHHYMLLVDVTADTNDMRLPSGSECDVYNACRLPQFPSLTDLQTGDICYKAPQCQSDSSLFSLLADANDMLNSESPIKLDDLLNTLLCQTSAATVPLAPEPLCNLLQDQRATTVQDALNILCEFEDDGCATFSISPGEDWQRVFDRIPKDGDAHLCFHEGIYHLEETLIVSGKGHLKISCAGAGTQFVQPSSEAVIKFEDCNSVIIEDGFFSGGRSGPGNPQDQTYDHLYGALTFDNCAQVNLHRVTLQCNSATRLFASCLTVSSKPSSPGRVKISDCNLKVGHQQVGMLLLNQQRISVADNQIQARTKPRSMTLDSMLKDATVANRVQEFMIKGAVIRDFNRQSDGQRKNLKNIQTSQKSGNRQVMFESPIAANHWRNTIKDSSDEIVYASNNQLLNSVKAASINLLQNPQARVGHSAINRWIEALKKQNPSVMAAGIVCGGEVAKQVRIRDNTINGAHMGIQVGVSNRSQEKTSHFHIGETRIQGNSIHILLSPLATKRRGGIFVGNCTQLSITDNSVQVQRFQVTHALRVESIRVYGSLGRKLIVKDNYSVRCDVGIKIAATDRQEGAQQWLVADNMFVDAETAVDAPKTVQRRNNLT